jgi:hypothetical protein
LVAELLRQIYEDDPACQVLLTAEAHSAVDHLRDQVSKFAEARHAVDPNWVAPLAVRLRQPKPNEVERPINDPAAPVAIARQILGDSIRVLEARQGLPDYLQEWVGYARTQYDVLAEAPSASAPGSEDNEEPDANFDRLVRGAVVP